MKAESGLRFEDGVYASSFDGVGPLRALAAYRDDGMKKPLMVCMHSYGGDRRQMGVCLRKHAGKGFFALAPDMRGRAESAGKRDDGGVEVADIYDAVEYALKAFADQIDSDNLNIVGWSGGGGSVYMATVRMPELFRSAQAYYGISDYGYLARCSDSWMAQISGSLGQSPDEAPFRYATRDAVRTIRNNRCTRFQIFWDEEETLCPKEMNEKYLLRAAELGMTNIIGRPSRAGDYGRWFHGKEVHPEIAEAQYEPQILAKEFPKLRLPDEGELEIPGFLITSRFTVCIGTGENGSASLSYADEGNKLSLKFGDARADSASRAWIRVPRKSSFTCAWNKAGEPQPLITRADDTRHAYLYHVDLSETITLERQPDFCASNSNQTPHL